MLTQAHRALAAIDVVVKTGTADVDSSPLYRALIENPAYGICRMDSHGNFLDANETLVVMLGYLSKDALLKPSTNVVWDPSTRAQVLEACRQTGYVQRIEVEWACQNGAAIQVRLGGRQVWAEPGVPNGYELIVEDVTEQRALEAHLRYLVATDALTGLANYRRLAEALGGEIERSTRTGRPFAILMFDLNGMKRINDRYGHLAGNRALCRLADALRASCRSIDTLARCGGDEFVVVLPETRASEAGVLARRICHRLADDPEQPPLATSVGLAVYPHDGDTIDHLFCTADHALYKMKNGAT